MGVAELIAKGADAHQKAAAMKGKNEPPYTVKTGTVMGDVTLESGMMWSGYQKIIIWASSFGVYYMKDDSLYRQDAKDFIRDELLVAFEKAGTSSKPIVRLYKATFEFIMGLVAPWYVTLGYKICETAYYYITYTELINSAYTQSGKLLSTLIWLRRLSPTFFNKMMWSIGKEILKDVPSSVSAEDIAFFLGRVLMSVKNYKKPDAIITKITISLVVKLALKVAGIVGLLRTPGIIADSTKKNTEALAQEVRKELTLLGIASTPGECEIIVKELQTNKNEASEMMKQMKEASEQLTPLLEQLGEIMKED